LTEEEIRSKTRVKRDLKEVQAFVHELVDTPDALLGQLPLSADIIDEIRAARGMKLGARKRQVGFVSKRMATEPVDEARALLRQLQQPASRANTRFHRLEGWRDSLLAGDDELIEELVDELGAGRQHLRNLVRSARREAARESGRESRRKSAARASRQLFRYLRELVEAGRSDQSPGSGISAVDKK
jgi:ribosome-associated protein